MAEPCRWLGQGMGIACFENIEMYAQFRRNIRAPETFSIELIESLDVAAKRMALSTSV
jgi:hypothetical protein